MAAPTKKPAKKTTTRSQAAPAKKTARPAARKSAPTPVVNSELTRRMVAAAAAACEDKKGEDTRILELDAADSGFTDFFLITSGANERQTQTIADEVELRLKRDFATYPNSVEGRRQGEWILMDYVDFLVPVFSAEKRSFYGLERLRKTATTLSIADLNTELKARIASVRESATKKRVSQKEPAKKKTVKPAKSAAKKAVAPKVVKKSVAKKAPAKAPARAMVKAAGKKATGTKKG